MVFYGDEVNVAKSNIADTILKRDTKTARPLFALIMNWDLLRFNFKIKIILI